MYDNEELVAKIEEYDLYDDDIVSSICEFYKNCSYITEKQASVLQSVVEEFEESGGETFSQHYNSLKS